MKNILISFLALILFISCQTTSGVIQDEAVTVLVVPDSEPQFQAQSRGYSELILPNGVSTRNTERGKVLVADKKIIFEFGKSTLPKDTSYVLRDVVKYILDNNPDVRIILEAHTSNQGISYPYNYALALERSAVGRTYFNTLGVSSERLMTKSYGESLPEYPKQKDLRRYEFVVIENENDLMRYNKFFSTINAQADMTYSIYIKRVKAYEQRNGAMISDETFTFEDEEVIENELFVTEIFTDESENDEFTDEQMFIDDDVIIIN